jgi:hypothetical protein
MTTITIRLARATFTGDEATRRNSIAQAIARQSPGVSANVIINVSRKIDTWFMIIRNRARGGREMTLKNYAGGIWPTPVEYIHVCVV